MTDELDEIVKFLREEKTENLKPSLKKLKEKSEKLREIDQMELLKKEQSENKIKTGTLIDEMIGGGLPPSSDDAVTAMLLYGEYGSGKTQTCFTMAVECPDDVVYIDIEGSYRAERIVEICNARGKNWQEVLKKIHLFRPKSWVEQMMTYRSLPSPVDTISGRIGLIIVDSLTKAFRGIEFSGRQFLSSKQLLIREFIFQMEEVAKSFACALILTTQISESPQASPYLPDWTGQKAVGGASVLHQPAFIIFFRKGQGNVRIARMMDSSWNGLAERPFVITEGGIQDLPEDAEIREELLKKAEQFEEKQKQEEIKKGEKKKRGRPSNKKTNGEDEKIETEEEPSND